MTFSNADLSGGYVARYGDTGEEYGGHECFVDGILCRADEAYLGGIVVEAVAGSSAGVLADSNKPWFWEGNVVRALTAYLAGRGWAIESTADTESGESGPDITAKRKDQILIVEVKGYPSKVYERGPKKGQPKRTNPPTQARHWVAEAILTALLRQADNRGHHVAIAFAESPVYSNVIARIRDALKRLRLIVLFVRQSGEVVIVEDEDGVLDHDAPP